jgi:proteasome activator subunit 4
VSDLVHAFWFPLLDRSIHLIRYLQVTKAVWAALSTLYQEQPKEVVNPCLNKEVELAELVVSRLEVNAGFTLTDPQDPRYQKVVQTRIHFGEVLQRAASALRKNTAGEDHIDAVLSVARSIDIYLLEYGLHRSTFEALKKNYSEARRCALSASSISPCVLRRPLPSINLKWTRQRENSRLVFLKRAQVYHSGRLYLHALYRQRSALDDELLQELVELSLSPYLRVRRFVGCSWKVKSAKWPSQLLAVYSAQHVWGESCELTDDN